jgi:hypothetical protein
MMMCITNTDFQEIPAARLSKTHEIMKIADFIVLRTPRLWARLLKREQKIRPIHECRCDERLKTKVEEYTRLVYIGLHGGLEHLKIVTRLIDEKFFNAMGEYVT